MYRYRDLLWSRAVESLNNNENIQDTKTVGTFGPQ